MAVNFVRHAFYLRKSRIIYSCRAENTVMIVTFISPALGLVMAYTPSLSDYVAHIYIYSLFQNVAIIETYNVSKLNRSITRYSAVCVK